LNPAKRSRYFAPVGAKGFEFVLPQKLDPKALGSELRRLRENCLVSIADLAERMDWHPTNVSRLERGGDKREPTLSSLNLYVRMLGFELVLVTRPKPHRATAKQGDAAREPSDSGKSAPTTERRKKPTSKVGRGSGSPGDASEDGE